MTEQAGLLEYPGAVESLEDPLATNPNMIGLSNCQSKCTLSLRLMVRAFYKGNRIPWMEDILSRDTVEKYLIG